MPKPTVRIDVEWTATPGLKKPTSASLKRAIEKALEIELKKGFTLDAVGFGKGSASRKHTGK